MVIVDRFTKMIRLKAITTNISSEEIAKIYSNEIWKLYGILRKILSDRSPQFTSKFMKELVRMLGMTRQLSTVYYPQTDRQTNREDQPRNRNISITLHQLPARQLDRMDSSCGIPI